MNDIVVEARSSKFFIWSDQRFKFLNGDRGGLTLYFPPRGGDGDSIDFDDSGSVADHVQWNIFGLDSYGGEIAADAGVWRDAAQAVVSSRSTTLIRLIDESGAVSHGPPDYETIPTTSDLDTVEIAGPMEDLLTAVNEGADDIHSTRKAKRFDYALDGLEAAVQLASEGRDADAFRKSADALRVLERNGFLDGALSERVGDLTDAAEFASEITKFWAVEVAENRNCGRFRKKILNRIRKGDGQLDRARVLIAKGRRGAGLRRYAQALKLYRSGLDLAVEFRLKRCGSHGFSGFGGGFGFL